MRILGNEVYIEDRLTGFLQRDDTGNIIWYVSPRRTEKHYHVMHQGWGVAVDIVEFLRKQAHCRGITLVIDQHRCLRASIPTIRAYGIVDQYEGFEPQLFLKEKYWMEKQQMLDEYEQNTKPVV